MSALAEMERLVAEDRLAHAYIIKGDPLREGRAFALEFLALLFAHSTREDAEKLRHRLEARAHPDVLWIEPASKLRLILESATAEANNLIGQKSFEGGWKAVVFLGAERMNTTAANKFLKTLEEPPPRTMILLVSASPENLLPTIRSRCQMVIAPRRTDGARSEAETALLELMAMGPPRTLFMRLSRAASLTHVFKTAGDQAAEPESGEEDDEEEENVEDKVASARESATRRRIYQELICLVDQWYRDVLVVKCGGQVSHLHFPEHLAALEKQATLATPQLRKLLDNTAEVAKRMESNLPLQVVFESAVL